VHSPDFGPAPAPALHSENQAAETMEEQNDCIRVLYPRHVSNIRMQRFLEPENKVMEDAVEDLEAQIINAYELEPPPPARISHKVALDALETLTLYKLQTGTMNSMQQQSFYREQCRIEGAQTAGRGQQRRRTLAEGDV